MQVGYDLSSNIRQADTGEGPSEAIWKHIPRGEILENPQKGIYLFDDFHDLPAHGSTASGVVSGALGRYSHYIYQGGGITGGNLTGGVGGVAVFASDGDNEGAAIGPQVGGFNLAAAKGKFAYEARVKFSTIADTKFGAFLGLLEGGAIAAGVPLATDGTLADKNFIGFHRLEGDGDQLDFVWKADGVTQVSHITDAIELVADTWIKIGFLFEPVAVDARKITILKNGVPLSTFVTTALMAAAAFPSDIALGPAIATMNATGSTPGNMSVDWHSAAQLRRN